MREVFHDTLEDIQGRLAEISELVTEAIEKATAAFASGDVSLAEDVIANDDRIDALVLSTDEIAIETLAMQQPVAQDLRVIVTALRVSASLERMGDLAEHIAQLVRSRYPERAIPKGLKKTFTKMGELDVQVARTLTKLLKTQDLQYATLIRDTDDDIDELHASVYERVLADTFTGEIPHAIDATLASRYHERFADHAVSVAKKVVYLATGDWAGSDDEDSLGA
ncbi:phosphate transport system regulatory protein PhoU [Microbacterium faecale]|uniref:Phosphate-specific transport system accessory protein PhoU n=1 Tax=Microbacterium faecale TaxID=1804630 RepID=A0A916Y6H1_9MICO|nr:phosphate signaling complex protein PhoU [Microbacterium faecale]GGD32470.1 phosphate transport system regulatory protein PhoU [Microbacterium faecale]HJB62959.1 phosphate signaling complex protein PhoU [Candidatus Microbacterium pullistercoris]